MKVSVSILKEYDDLINAVDKVNKSKADYLHIDVMDGKFVNNLKFPVSACKDIMEASNKKIDMHLMVSDEDTVLKYAYLMPDIITFHVEILNNKELITNIKKMGIKVGLAINPNTNIDTLLPYINDIDLVLFMSVEPGYGGQEFILSVLDKVKELKDKVSSNIVISIDGGINDRVAPLCKEAGCDMVVSGSFITDSENYDEKIKALT